MDGIENQTFISTCENDTEKFAAAIAAAAQPGTVITLNGDLGAGKTVFARGFARGLGITEPVSSPTYTIVQEYELPQGGRLYHLDLYRINGVDAALAFGVDEFLDDPRSFALVEWPERIDGIIPDDAVRITLRHLDDSTREIKVTR